MAKAGVLRRPVGPDGKKVNELVIEDDGAPPRGAPADLAVSVDPDFSPAVLERSVDHSRPPGNSMEQREAERVMPGRIVVRRFEFCGGPAPRCGSVDPLACGGCILIG